MSDLSYCRCQYSLSLFYSGTAWSIRLAPGTGLSDGQSDHLNPSLPLVSPRSRHFSRPLYAVRWRHFDRRSRLDPLLSNLESILVKKPRAIQAGRGTPRILCNGIWVGPTAAAAWLASRTDQGLSLALKRPSWSFDALSGPSVQITAVLPLVHSAKIRH